MCIHASGHTSISTMSYKPVDEKMKSHQSLIIDVAETTDELVRF